VPSILATFKVIGALRSAPWSEEGKEDYQLDTAPSGWLNLSI